MKRLIVCVVLLPALLLAATHAETWQSGKVVDMLTTAGGESAAKGHLRPSDVDAQVLVIQAGKQQFLAKEHNAWHNACLAIPGDSIKFEVEGHRLLIEDPVGTRCFFDLVQEAKGE